MDHTNSYILLKECGLVKYSPKPDNDSSPQSSKWSQMNITKYCNFKINNFSIQHKVKHTKKQGEMYGIRYIVI